MIDLGADLDGYGEGDENSDVPTGFAPSVPGAYVIDGIPHSGKGIAALSGDPNKKGLHNIGKLADLQKGGFNTVAPPKYRAYQAIRRFDDLVDLITNAMTPDEIRAREKDE